MTLHRLLSVALLLSASALAQYKIEPAAAVPEEASALAPALAKTGLKVLKPDGSTLLELWLVATPPAGGETQQNTSLSSLPHGTLIGLVRYPVRSSDRKGQQIRPGVYSLRYSFYPMNGDHQGVAPQRDFAILSPAAEDSDAAAKPGFDALMDLSRKGSRTPHPLVLSIWKDDAGAEGTVSAQGDDEQVLHTRLGAVPVAIMIVGKFQG